MLTSYPHFSSLKISSQRLLYIVRSADFNYRPNDFDGSVVIEAAVQTLQTKAIKLRLLDSLGHDFKVDDCKQ